MASEIKVDTVSEKTSGSGVTIDGLLIKDGGISGDVSLIGTTPTFTIGDAGAEDAALVFDGNAQDFYIGLDDSADDLIIGQGSTVGTNPAISIDENQNVTIADGSIDFNIASHDTSNGLKLGGTLVSATAAELNILDGVTSTAAELNLIDGGTARGTTAIADGDGVLINDAGTMRMTSVETLKTYMSAEKNNPSFSAKMANHQQVGDNVLTKVAFDTANYQTSGTYDTSNYRFTPGVAGNYQFIIQIQGNSKANANLHSIMIKLYKNGSVLGEHVDGIHTNYATSYIFAGNLTFNVTTASDADDYFEVYAAVNDTSSTPEVNKYGSHFSGFLISGSA